MNIIIRSSHAPLSDEQRADIERRLLPLGDHVKEGGGSSVLSVDIALVREREAGTMFRVDASLEEKGHLFAAQAEDETIDAAVDAVRDQLARERSHAHGKERRLGRRAAARTKEWLRRFGG
jgi:ribosome-associated translation inhibitor RaiA